jgi:hypothetical protein
MNNCVLKNYQKILNGVGGYSLGIVNHLISVAEPHHFYAAPALGKNFDAAPAPAPTLLYSKTKF